MHFTRQKIEQVPAREWEAWRDTHDAVVIDVREPNEWAGGTLPGARKMAMSRFNTEWQQLDPGTSVLVVCRSGNRSNSVAKALDAAGFDRVANLSGGMVALGLA
jgi:rhodanese-related sulfurtransferase